MKMYRTIFGLGVGLLAALVVQAQAPAAAPAGTTGMCKDGSYYSGASKQGACRGHKGVQEWYGASGAAPAAAAPAAPAPTTSAAHRASKKERAAAEAAAAPAAAAATAAPAAPRYTPPATAAPGGGAGQVWVNTKSKVYHCQSDFNYGKTKEGQYMTEAAAKASGARPARGKACQ